MPQPATRLSRTDGEATRKRILETAGELFAAQGLAETTNKMIASKAAVDLASINYHFGNRKGLYQNVLVEAHRRLINIDDLEQIAASEQPARVKLRQLLDYLVSRDARKKGQWPVRVLFREVMSPSSHLLTLGQDQIYPKIGIILSIISGITGIPQGEPALLRCMLNIVAPCALLHVLGQFSFAPAVQLSAMSKEALVDHLYRFAMAGLDASREHYQANLV